ncbi:MAG: gliding motility protein GldB [Bacteroidia bacterium]|nr:gliding motility protein GldB [Bacteroidia bacterium]
MYKKKTLYFIPIIFFFVLLINCARDKFKTDVSHISVNIEIKRFDRELFSINPDRLTDYIPALESKYNTYFSLYNNLIINIGEPNQRKYAEYLTVFLDTYKEVYVKCEELFSNLKDIESELTGAFRYYKYYFPEKPVPQIYAHISGFNKSIVVADSLVSISLDKYLGSESEYYIQLGWPLYLRKRMDKTRIALDCLYAWVASEYEQKEPLDNLAGNMIEQGKIMYLLEALFPETPDSIKIGYTSPEWQWCERNEKNMWVYLIENKLLFSTDYKTIRKYIDEAPFTATFTQDSPGRAGIWVGWMIIRSYMKHNPEVTLPAIMQDNDFQKILNQSKYAP